MAKTLQFTVFRVPVSFFRWDMIHSTNKTESVSSVICSFHQGNIHLAVVVVFFVSFCFSVGPQGSKECLKCEGFV